MMRATPESPPMFENSFIDAFSRIPWWVVPLVWVPIILATLGWYFIGLGGSLLMAIPAAFAGVLIWTLNEYWLHRTVFHWEPAHPLGQRFHFIIHGVHHKWINDPYRLVMPPAVSLTLGAFYLASFLGMESLLATWLPVGWAWPLFAAFVVGYVNYDLTHYLVHHGRPRSKRMRAIRKFHMTHHFKEPERKFGFTTFVWDRIFGTA